MGMIDSWFWRHAYLLQFTDKNGILKDAFAFSMPPESESIQTAQRVSYTKTFGGVVVDDYGNDVTKISLSGTTGNKDLKVIYRGLLGFKMLNGEQEVLYLDNLIKKYGKSANLDNKQIWLYDLSKTSGLSLLSSTKNYWRVYIDSFKYTRDKSLPLSYKYQLEMTAVDGEKKNSLSINALSSILNKMNEIAEDAESLAAGIQEAIGGVVSQIDNYVSVFTQAVQKFKDCYDAYVNIVQGALENINGVISEVTSLGEYIINDSTREIQDSAINLYISAADVCAAASNLADYAENGLSDESFDGQWEQLLSEYDIDSKDSFDDLVKTMTDRLRVDGYKIKSETKSQVEISEKGGVVYYGVSEYTVRQGESFESLSIKFYGTPDYAEFLQSVNGASSIDTSGGASSGEDVDSSAVSTGSVIKIPHLTESDAMTFSGIIKPESDYDSFGKDVKTTDRGGFAVSNGDFETTSYEGTLSQSIAARLSTAAGAKIRNTAYGIKAEIGASAAVNAYLSASIAKTILEDERIESVDNIQYEGNGDRLEYTVDYTAKNKKQYQVNGEI